MKTNGGFQGGLAITSLTTMLERMEKGNLICRKQDESDKHGRSKEMKIANIGQVPYNISYPYRNEHFEEDLEKAFQLGARVAKTALGE